MTDIESLGQFPYVTVERKKEILFLENADLAFLFSVSNWSIIIQGIMPKNQVESLKMETHWGDHDPLHLLPVAFPAGLREKYEHSILTAKEGGCLGSWL